LIRRFGEGPVEGHYDVAVIGGGFTGLGAARQLAKAGVKVVVLEAETVGFGASGRNGGHLNNGLAHSFSRPRRNWARSAPSRSTGRFDDSIDTLEPSSRRRASTAISAGPAS
jgi:glycine/D-amino acid oxidase-like deaminating enzyme